MKFTTLPLALLIAGITPTDPAFGQAQKKELVPKGKQATKHPHHLIPFNL
jgi:hypothetical protein